MEKLGWENQITNLVLLVGYIVVMCTVLLINLVTYSQKNCNKKQGNWRVR